MAIAQKKCNEPLYWIELLFAVEYIEEVQFDSIHSTHRAVQLTSDANRRRKRHIEYEEKHKVVFD